MNSPLDYFTHYNAWLASINSEMCPAPTTHNPERITESEAVDFLTRSDLDLLNAGISRDTILIRRNLPNTQANLQSLSEALRSPKLYEKLGPEAQNFLAYTRYLDTIVSTFDTKDNAFNNDVLPHTSETINNLLSKTRDVMWSYQRPTSELYGYTLLSLYEKLIAYKTTLDSGSLLQKRNNLRAMVSHISWLVSNKSINELPQMIAYLENLNPYIYELLEINPASGPINTQPPEQVAESLLLGITNKLTTDYSKFQETASVDWSDGYDIGYQTALNDVLNMQLGNLSPEQKDLVLAALDKPVHTDVTLDDAILNERTDIPFTITLDDKIL